MSSIEEVELKDLEIIEEIGYKSLPIYYSLEHLHIIFKLPDYLLYKFILNSSIIGFVICKNTQRDNIHIMSISILDDYRQQGYGSKLIDYLKGLNTSLTLNVQEINRSAINFYIKNGFEIIEQKKNYYDTLDESDALYMKFR